MSTLSHTPQPELKFLTVEGPAAPGGAARRLAYWDWCGTDQPSTHVVVCVHGLSRQGRDFDTLAAALLPECRVVCVDVAGRGHSDWLADPMAYQLTTYAADIAQLLSHLRGGYPQQRPCSIDWVGTSMGGLIGMGLAAQPGAGLRRVVLNDVGPAIRAEALARIGGYLGQDLRFDSEDAALAHLWQISTGFGPHTAEQWRALSLPMLRADGGRIRLHYDPAIAVPFRALASGADAAAAAGEAALWALYDAMPQPTLLLRGAESDLLSRETAMEMTRRGPRARLREWAGVGHAPTLVAADQVAAVRDFLLEAA